jgi:ferric-dicitrate binding protein FerR (iron transport regulator)
MSSKSNQFDELDRLLMVHVEGLDDEGTARLAAILRDDAAAQQRYLDSMELHSMLQWQSGAVRVSMPKISEAFSPLEQMTHQAQKSSRVSPYFRTQFMSRAKRVFGRVAAVLVFMGILAAIWIALAPAELAVASLTKQFDSRWSVAPEETLRQGARLVLQSGIAELNYSSGVAVTLEGPCDITLAGTDRIYLASGKLVASVPQAGHGFRVTTEAAEVVDLGTEFGVQVDPTGKTDVAVFKGRVELHGSETAGQGRGHQELKANRVGTVTASGVLSPESKSLAEAKLTFVRRTPTSAYQAAVLRDRPMLYWPFEDSMDSPHASLGSISIALNKVGTFEAVESVPGVVGRGVKFTPQRGRKGYLVADRKLKLPGEAFTLECWGKHVGKARGTMFFLEVEPSEGSAFGVAAFLYQKSGLIRGTVAGNIVSIVDVMKSVDQGAERRWHHLVLVKDGKRVMLYVDGEFVNSKLAPQITPKQCLAFVGRSGLKNGVSRYFDGEIDEVALYGHALSAEQAQRHYRIGRKTQVDQAKNRNPRE